MRSKVQKKRMRRRIAGHIFTALFLIGGWVLGFIFIQNSLNSSKNNVSGEEILSTTGAADKSDDEDEIIVVVDAGHGGKDQGTSYGNILEKDINLKIAEYVKGELTERGVKVVMTREDDIFISLEERTFVANSENADFFLSIHVDSYYDDCSIRGVTCYYTGTGLLGDRYAQLFTNVFEDAGYTTRNVVQSDLYVLNHTTMPAVLVETGFISNDKDRKNLTDDEYLKTLAATLADGVMKALESIG